MSLSYQINVYLVFSVQYACAMNICTGTSAFRINVEFFRRKIVFFSLGKLFFFFKSRENFHEKDEMIFRAVLNLLQFIRSIELIVCV